LGADKLEAERSLVCAVISFADWTGFWIVLVIRRQVVWIVRLSAYALLEWILVGACYQRRFNGIAGISSLAQEEAKS
jgi:hypothetical protein